MKTQPAPIEIFIVDDQELLRQGLRGLLHDEQDFKVIGEAVNGEDLLKQVENNMPDVILMDIRMPVMDGIEATRVLTKKYPGVFVLAISVFSHEYNIIKMIVAGAKGHISKGVSKGELIDAIKTVHNNSTYYDKPVSVKLTGMIVNKHFDPHQKEFTFHLTAREAEVLRYICMQKSNRDISAILDLSVRTVEDFRNKLLIKTNSDNTVGLVLFAMRYGLYNPEQTD
jgi:DNA-binding NarL/FixJ family response regulator